MNSPDKAGAAKPDAPPPPRPEDVIHLDRTRTRSAPAIVNGVMGMGRIPDYSTVHGQCRDDDPHYRVRYIQDGLPFDEEGSLIPDDGKTAPWVAASPGEDGKPITYRPLYTPDMRKKLARKYEKAIAGMRRFAAPSAADLDEDVDEREAGSDDINLPFWLTGRADYQPFMVYAAIKKRYGINIHSVADAVRLLVAEEQVVNGGAVRDEFKRHLQKVA